MTEVHLDICVKLGKEKYKILQQNKSLILLVILLFIKTSVRAYPFDPWRHFVCLRRAEVNI